MSLWYRGESLKEESSTTGKNIKTSTAAIWCKRSQMSWRKVATWCDAHCISFGFESFRGVKRQPLKVTFIFRLPIFHNCGNIYIATTSHLLLLLFHLVKFLSENNMFPFCPKHELAKKQWVFHKHSFKPFQTVSVYRDTLEPLRFQWK